MVFCHFERKKCSGTVFSNPNAFLRSRGVFLAKWLNHNIWHDILRWPPNSSWLAVVCRKHQYKADVYIYMYSLIEGNNCRLSASPSQHDLGKVPVEGTQCHQTRWYMSGYVGSMRIFGIRGNFIWPFSRDLAGFGIVRLILLKQKTNHRTETFALPTEKLYNCQSKAINACTSQSVKLM